MGKSALDGSTATRFHVPVTAHPVINPPINITAANPHLLVRTIQLLFHADNALNGFPPLLFRPGATRCDRKATPVYSASVPS